MARLSDSKVRNAQPRERPYKLFDRDGLHVIITPAGSKWWRQRFRQGGREKLLSLGTFPETSLSQARAKSIALRGQVQNNVDPSRERRERREGERGAASRTFKLVSLEWLDQTSKARKWTEDHRKRCLRRLELYFYGHIGSRDVQAITEDDIARCLRRMEDKNIIDTARRSLAECKEIFRFAKRRKLIPLNPLGDSRWQDLLPDVKVTHNAGIVNPTELGALLRAIESPASPSGFVVRQALRLLPHVFLRPGELRGATWSEIDFDRAEWRIPPARMKSRALHIVPLSRQALQILRETHGVTGPDGYCFPQVRNASRPISNGTLNVALHVLGFSRDTQTPHGFRTTASTILNELGFHPDAIERQLAHAPRDAVRASYNHAQFLPERVQMMAFWSNYLDQLRTGKPAEQPAKRTRTRTRREAVPEVAQPTGLNAAGQ